MVAKTGIRSFMAVTIMTLIAMVIGVIPNGCGGSSSGSSGVAVKPVVLSTIPANLAEDVFVNRKITATFSKAMDPATISTTTFTLLNGITPIAGAVTYTAAGATATFDPADDLTASTEYTATITTGAKDLDGRALESDYIWSFTTGTTTDTVKPVVASTSPADLATGVVVNVNIDVIFSEAMDPDTISTTTFTVVGPDAVAVTGTVGFATLTATFNPINNLTESSVYTATVTTGAQDLAGNPLSSTYIWTFTTGTTTGFTRAKVLLGTAGDFVILAKTGVSTGGATEVTGDIGLRPAAATFITGFGLTMDVSNEFSTSSLVTGRIYAANYAPPTPANLLTAVNDMEIAYTDAAGRTLPNFTELYTGNISGQTLVPGLYKWGTGVLMNGTTTTLTGSATDVWIFQIAQNLNVGNGAILNLTGGALPENVFWQVAGSTTLGTTANFKGIILCKTLIAMQTGAIFNGRALAQTAVTLDAATVTEPVTE